VHGTVLDAQKKVVILGYGFSDQRGQEAPDFKITEH